MTALPLSTDFTNNSVTEAQLKQAFTELRDYLNGLLGSSGNALDARANLQVQELNNNLTALASLVSDIDKLPYFTNTGSMSTTTLSPVARQLLDDPSFVAMLSTLGAAARGANSDITSLTGLTTALSRAQGGTGVTTVSAEAQAVLNAISTTQGTLLYRDATSWSSLGVGTVGQVLQSGGASANLSWHPLKLLAAVKFNSSGTIQGTAHNVSSVTRNAAGDYTLNFTSSLPNTNYIVSGSVVNDGIGNERDAYVVSGGIAIGSVRVATSDYNSSPGRDCTVMILIVGV